MNYSIIRSDNMVYVNGIGKIVDCSALDSGIHAIQWYGGASPAYGEVEFTPNDQGVKMPNERIADFSPYQSLVDAWNEAE